MPGRLNIFPDQRLLDVRPALQDVSGGLDRILLRKNFRI